MDDPIVSRKEYDLLSWFRTYVENVLDQMELEKAKEKLYSEFEKNKDWIDHIISQYQKGIRYTEK